VDESVQNWRLIPSFECCTDSESLLQPCFHLTCLIDPRFEVTENRNERSLCPSTQARAGADPMHCQVMEIESADKIRNNVGVTEVIGSCARLILGTMCGVGAPAAFNRSPFYALLRPR
jgi:hypothetical protein